MHGNPATGGIEMMSRLRIRWLPIALLAVVFGVSCAQYRIPTATDSLDEPQASWSIRAGTSLNEREVCRSDIDQSCVIPASSDGEPTSVVVSIYLHPVGDAKTTYHGAFVATFLSTPDGGGYERQVDLEIDPGHRPTGFTTAGVVTSTPGHYAFKMALLADVATRSDPRPFEDVIPVEVIASS
jgi:hypothetical protein